MNFNLTKEQKEKLSDKDWRVNHFYKIVDKNKNKIFFKRNRAQEHYNQKKGSRNIILKSRQLGFTTDESVDMLDDCLFARNFDALLIAHTDKDAVKIFDKKVDFAWKNFPPELKDLYKVHTDRTNELKFDFQDNSFSSIAVSNSGRSGTYNRVHISEFAKLCKKFPSRAEEVITGTIPSVPLDGRIDIESTAEGEFGEFYDMFWEAWNRGEPTNPAEYKAHFYNWTWDDEELNKISEDHIRDFLDSKDFAHFKEHQAKHNLSDREITYYYFKWVSLNKDWNKLRQEYPTTPEEAFIGSGNKLFDQDKVALQKQFIKEGENVGDWIYYEDYTPGHVYGGGADVAEGVGQDSSTIVIFDFTPLKPKVVAEFCSNTIEADVFAYEVKNGGTRYGNCIMAVERNNHGHATIATLKGIYHNIYSEVKTDKLKDTKTEKLGWQTNLATKPKMLVELKTAINDELIEIPSKHIQQEMRSYDKEDMSIVRFDPEQTKHWDRLIATAIAWQMKSYVIHKKQNQFLNTDKTFE